MINISNKLIYPACILFLLLASIPGTAFCQSLDFLDDEYLYEDDETAIDTNTERWEYMREQIQTPFQDVPRGHWAYQAVEHLASLGLLDGYKDGVFQGDRTVTRYEMAAIVDKILKNYLTWTDTGKVTRYKEIKVKRLPGEIQSDLPLVDYEVEQQAAAMPQHTPVILPPIASPNRNVTVSDPTGGTVTLTKKGPSGMQVIQDAPAPAPAPAPTPVTNVPTTVKPVTGNNTTRPANEWETTHVQVEEEVELTQKAIDMVEDLANTFKDELKELDKKFKKEIKEVSKVAANNTRQIEKLKQEDQRFKVTGSDNFTFRVSGNYDDPWTDDDTDYYGEETSLYNDLSLTFTSQPDPQQDLTISATTKARTHLGTRNGYYGYIDGTNTAFNVHEFSINYSDTSTSSKNPRNFKLRSLRAGNTSVMFSPLTMFGHKLQGLSMELNLNDYTLKFFGGRLAYHYPQFLGQLHYHKPGEDTQYDRYAYGMNVSTPIFGETRSMGNFQKIFIYDNDKTNYYWNFFGVEPQECIPGTWARMRFTNDPAVSIGDTSDETYKDMFCLPPEKNSVTSAFVRYPVKDNIYVTAEYAHSTFYKPSYKALSGPNYLLPDQYERYQELLANGVINEPEGDPIQECDTSDLSQKGSGGCWFESKERRDQDDGFLILFDFNKGPVQIFPIGYARLGSEFVTKYFGLPGFDMSSLMGGGDDEGGGGGGIGFLPIAIQSLEAYITNFSYDKQQEDNYKYSTYYIWGNEISPMYFDPGLVMFGLSSNESKSTSLPILTQFVEKINTRRDTLKLNVWTNSLKYYLSDDINLTLGYTRAKIRLPKTCLDGDINVTVDDYGNVISSQIGDGVYGCDAGGDDAYVALDVKVESQSMELFWKTSKNSEATTKLGTTNLGFKLDFKIDDVVGLVEDLVPAGRYFTFSQNFKYRLTSSTAIDLLYEKDYDMVETDCYTDDCNYKYPVIDNHTFTLKISTTF